MSHSRAVLVPEGLAGQRADTGIARLLGLSRSKVVSLLAQDGATMDGELLTKSSVLVEGAMLDIQMPAPPAEPTIVPTQIDNMPIVFDDDHVVVVSKPVGVAAHSSPGWEGPTVVGGLAAAGYRISTSGIHERQGIVHRLDVGTSGLMMVAKSELSYSVLKDAFRKRSVHKVYETVVQGLPDPSSGTIEAPIGRHPKHDGRMAVIRQGKPSVTHYELLEAYRVASRLRVQLETGRTHQIRVHMQAVKHPCVGDPMYGGDPVLARKLGMDRQWLHAVTLGFEHPRTGEWMQFDDELPEDLQHAVDVLAAMGG